MAHPLYGAVNCVETKEYPVAASQFFRHAGVNLVYLDGSGHVTLALTATATLLGMAIVPKGMGAGASADYWKSSATAGADKIAVVVDPEAKYLLPADNTVTEAMKGNACDIIAVNDGTATYVDVDNGTYDILIIVDQGLKYGGAATDVVVKINPIKFQAD
jgi:hypothetical protein